MKTLPLKDYTHIALVAALYVLLTALPPFNAISYGPYQFRLSEMINFLAFYNRKYIIAVTIGVVVANLFAYGPIDMVVGGLSTLIFVSLGMTLFAPYQGQRVLGGLFDKAFFYFSLFFAASMFTIAAELTILAGTPFFLTWLTTGLGELVSLLVGAIIIERLHQRFNFEK